jgi:Kef-type K+ transport system membrane component KefB
VPHASLVPFFVQFLLLLGAATAGGMLARRAGLPAVVGEMLAGVALGPTLLGALAPVVSARLFPAAAEDPALSAGRDAVLRLGMVLFLFAAGREVRLSSVRARGRGVALTSLLGIVVPLALGAGLVWAAPSLFRAGTPVPLPTLALFVGTALSISALPVIARILLDLGLLRRPFGGTVLAAATLDDLIGWSLFAALLRSVQPAHGGTSPWLALAGALGATALLLGAVRPQVRRHVAPLLARPGAPPAVSLGVPLLVAFALAALAEWAGLHAVFGAFLAGTLFAPDDPEEDTTRDPVAAVALGLFAPAYFASVGLKVNFASHFDPVLVVLVLLVACAGKVAGAGLGARLGGLPAREALAVGCAMNARGAMEILLATVALDAGLIDARLFVALVMMAVATSVLAGPAVRRLLPRED